MPAPSSSTCCWRSLCWASFFAYGGIGADVPQRARIVGLAVLCLMLHFFVLRDPIAARFGGIAGPALVLGLWVAGRVSRSRNVLSRAAVLLTAALAVWATATLANWPRHLEADLASPGRIRQNLRLMAASPPPMGDALPSASLAGLVSYLRECTTPEDRVYVSWFVPELYYYAQRGFAAGMAVTFGSHWSEPRYQQRMVEKVASESVPVVILQMSSYNEFWNLYPAFDRHLQAHYRVAGETDFGNRDVGPTGYRVLVRSDRMPAGVHPASSMPCFRQDPRGPVAERTPD